MNENKKFDNGNISNYSVCSSNIPLVEMQTAWSL